jgi:hypothetical protein
MSPAKQAAQAERLTDGWWALATTCCDGTGSGRCWMLRTYLHL